MFYNPVTAALRAKRARLCPSDQVINAPDAKLNLAPPSPVPAAAVKAAWMPVLPGQSIPMLGEEVGYVEPCDAI